MATKESKKPRSLTALNKDFMANFSYDMLNKNKPASAQPSAWPAQPLRQAAPYDPVAEIQAATKGAQQMPTPQGYRRPVTRRGMSGAELDANGNDPGSGMNWFDKNNSPAQVDARNARQAVLDQRRGAQMAAAGASAVAERKALQEMGQAPFQLQEANRATNSVKGNDGYMTLFDGKGNAVGTNRPMAKRVFDPGKSSTNPMNPNLQAQIQQGFNQDAQKPRAPQQPSSPNFLDSYATPGGSNASVVGTPSAPGTPVGGNVSPPRPGGIAPVDFFGSIDTSNAPAPQFNQPPPNSGPAPSGINYNFDQQIADQVKRNSSAPTFAAPYNNPFIGAPYGGKLSAAQNEIMGLFAPKTTGSGMFGERQQTGRVRPGNTGPLDSVIPGMPGQLGWPMMQNKDVNSFAQFFPGMDWSADYGDSSRSRIQQNFNDLIKQNAIRVGPDGNYQIIPQYPMEQMLKQY